MDLAMPGLVDIMCKLFSLTAGEDLSSPWRKAKLVFLRKESKAAELGAPIGI